MLLGRDGSPRENPNGALGLSHFRRAALFMEHFILDSYCHILVIRLHLLVGCRNDFPWEMKAIPFSKDALFFRGEESKACDREETEV